MAARALAAVCGRRIAGQTGAPVLASCRRGSSAQPEEQSDGGAAAQVEAALNRKNVEALLPEETVAALHTDDAWVPDHDTGVFVPADEAAGASVTPGAPPAPPHPAGSSSSVLDKTVFVREDDMEDVERPAIDMADGNAK